MTCYESRGAAWARYGPTTRDYSNVLLARCDKAAQKGGHKKGPRQGRGTRRSAAVSERRPCRGRLTGSYPPGVAWSVSLVRAGVVKPNALAQSVREAVGAWRADGRYRPVGPRNGYACQVVMRSVYGNRAPFHGPWRL